MAVPVPVSAVPAAVSISTVTVTVTDVTDVICTDSARTRVAGRCSSRG